MNCEVEDEDTPAVSLGRSKNLFGSRGCGHGKVKGVDGYVPSTPWWLFPRSGGCANCEVYDGDTGNIPAVILGQWQNLLRYSGGHGKV